MPHKGTLPLPKLLFPHAKDRSNYSPPFRPHEKGGEGWEPRVTQEHEEQLQQKLCFLHPIQKHQPCSGEAGVTHLMVSNEQVSDAVSEVLNSPTATSSPSSHQVVETAVSHSCGIQGKAKFAFFFF